MYTSPLLVFTLAQCLPLATLVASFPTTDQHLPSLKRDGTVEQSIFFDISGTEVETKVAKLKDNGYQPTSLSIHGSPTDAKYAGIWTKQKGKAYETIFGANETAYNAWIDQWKAKGYVSTHVSATGSDSDAVFAGVMQQMPSVENWLQKCGLTSPYLYDNLTMGIPMVTKGVSVYGAPKKHRYCVLGHENTNNYQQTVRYQVNRPIQYKQLEAEETLKRFWRPVYIDSSEDGILTPIFDDTSVGQWIVRTDLTTTQLEQEISAQKSKNMYPVHISGAGSTEAKYVVIFAEQTTPLERNWHVTGNVTGFKDNSGLTIALDDIMKKFMQKNGVRQAQIAASVNGTVLASRACTWAESDRAIVEPSDKFLLGSVSKMFTYAAVGQLIEKGQLNLTTRVYPLLGYNNPADPRALNITVKHLLEHTAGYDRRVTPDIGFIFGEVAQSLNQSTPATLRQLIEYVYAKPLDFTPGEDEQYSNYGTLLLSYVFTNLTGEPYMSYVKKNVLGDFDVDLYATAADKHTNDRIVQETKVVAYSALEPMSQNKASGVHGGDGAVKEEAIGSFGLRASASTISRFLGSHSASSYGPRQSFVWRDGSVDGARSLAYSMEELDWTVILNTRELVTDGAFVSWVFGELYNVWFNYPLASAK